MPAPLSLSVLYHKSNAFGLSDDVRVVERIWKHISDALDGRSVLKPHYLDFREPYREVDLQLHLEIPVYAAIPWARVNLLLVNSDQWDAAAQDAYLPAYDAILFRDPHSMEVFRQRLEGGPYAEVCSRMVMIPWCASSVVSPMNPNETGTQDAFLSLLGGSEHKFQFMRHILPVWKASYPPLTLYTTRKDHYDALCAVKPVEADAAANVTVIHKDVSLAERASLAAAFRGHLVCSTSEGYGYAAAHAEVAGAFTLMNRLPVFCHYYEGQAGVAWISHPLCTDTLEAEMEAAMAAYRGMNLQTVRVARQQAAMQRFATLMSEIAPLVRRMDALAEERRTKGIHRLPPILPITECPPITVVTPTYNRRNLLDIAMNNLLSTDYPHRKIQWIVVEDHEDSTQMATDKIIGFQRSCPELDIKYIPIQGRMSIGQKRNLGVDQADHEIILFMDDDDHYPPTSFRRRVAWLLYGEKRGQSGFARIACCTTIAMYDLRTGISAVNVPPMSLPFCQRISEATLTFVKSAWTERPFSEVSVAEGEEWIRGREQEVLEMPPQQIIVAFSHVGNQSGRRIPPKDQAPSCFWGFSRDYLSFIHGLVGVEIEDAKVASPSTRRR